MDAVVTETGTPSEDKPVMDAAAEVAMLDTHGGADPLTGVRPALGVADIMAMRQAADVVHVADPLKQYLVQVATATRAHPHLALGVSPRATLAMLRVARVWAAMAGRDFVIPDDIKAMAGPVFAHRLLLTAEAEAHGVDLLDTIDDVFRSVPVPRPRG